MLVLLPPSETKRPGGEGAPLDIPSLRLPRLAPLRRRLVEALVGLSGDPDGAARVLGLSARQLGEVAVNAALASAPTMPAVDRYTGVLFSALDAPSLDDAARGWLGEHALIQTAPLGPVGALDAIPAYRLAAGKSLPGIGPQRRFWGEATTAALRDEAGNGLVLDLRSQAYRELGPVPGAVVPAIVQETEGGAMRALNHFNKHAKGELTRLLAERRPAVSSVGDLLDWGRVAGLDLRPGEAETAPVLVAAP